MIIPVLIYPPYIVINSNNVMLYTLSDWPNMHWSLEHLPGSCAILDLPYRSHLSYSASNLDLPYLWSLHRLIRSELAVTTGYDRMLQVLTTTIALQHLVRRYDKSHEETLFRSTDLLLLLNLGKRSSLWIRRYKHHNCYRGWCGLFLKQN